MDYRNLAAELIRHRRGQRTQRALSRVLGYRSNVVFAWENGHDEPNARTFFQLVRKTGTAQLPSELPGCAAGSPDLTTKEGVTEYLQVLTKDWKISDLSRALARDRYAVSRFIKGQTEINLGDLLHVVDVTTLGLFAFLELLSDPSQLPSVAEEYQRLLRTRQAAIDMPWSPAVVHMADLPEYKQLVGHEPGWFASRLGVTTEEEERCLEHLVQSGQLERCDGRYRPARRLTLDSRPDPEGTRRLAAFWLREASQRVGTAGGGRYWVETLAVSEADLDAIVRLQVEYVQKLRNIVGQSKPTEAVAVATMALIRLGAPRT